MPERGEGRGEGAMGLLSHLLIDQVQVRGAHHRRAPLEHDRAPEEPRGRQGEGQSEAPLLNTAQNGENRILGTTCRWCGRP